MKFKEIKEGTCQIVKCLIIGMEQKPTKNGSSYVVMSLSDGESVIQAKLWNNTIQSVKVSPESVISAKLEARIYQGVIDYVVQGYGPADPDDKMEDYIKMPPESPELLYNELVKEAEGFQSSILKNLTLSLLAENKKQIMLWSAAKANHHNYRGGWLWHTTRMLRSAKMLADNYTTLNRSLLLAGTILHDVGKLREYDTSTVGNADYTIPGTLYGHTLLGIEMVDLICMKYQPKALETEEVCMLKHMIASHHGTLEWGAIVLPQIPEAMVLHELDMIDSRVDTFEQVYEKLEPGDRSEKVFALGNAYVYKPKL